MASKSGKSITTSVPTISIKFHANAEQIEELYGSDDEYKNEISDKNLAATKEKGSSSTGNIQDTAEGSPLKYLKLNKRSNSTEVSTVSDSSPPSDPWKFFSEIKGKIAKSVEEKITEIKARNQEDGSPSKGKTEGKVEKNTKENSSLSDSEELSESSLSRTCGIVSTTEGAEMSSDEESTSLKNETPTNLILPQSSALPVNPTLRQRFRLLKSSKNGGFTTAKEGTVSMSNLTKIYNISTDGLEQALPEHSEEVESGVDVLEDVEFRDKSAGKSSGMPYSKSAVLNLLERNIDNIEIDNDGTVDVKEVSGYVWRGDSTEIEGKNEVRTVFAPKGFFDLRYRIHQAKSSYLFPLLVLSLSIAYLLIQSYSVYAAGMLAGIFTTSVSYYIKNRITPSVYLGKDFKDRSKNSTKDIWEVPAVKEYQPKLKYEGWVNEYPDHYDPKTYHISLTQPAYLRLEGNFLRISNSTSKVPKRAMWNEEEIKKSFRDHRIYNLLGAKVSLLPVGLAKIRHWSKKYPIYLNISDDQLKFEDELASKDTDDEKEHSPPFIKKGTGFSFRKKMSSVSSPQRFSKLCAEQDNFYTDADVSRSDNSSPVHDEEKPITEDLEISLDNDEDNDNQSNLDDSWSNCTLDDSPSDRKIYLFARTDREKEDWFRRLCMATHPQSSSSSSQENGCKLKKAASTESILKDFEYGVYMSSILKAFKKREEETIYKFPNDVIEIINVSWLNAFLGRILFDCMCDAVFTSRIKDRIHRKLAAIKLPYFIEELSITELNLGKTSPLFKRISRPTIDDRGLWIDMAMTYEGLVVLTLMTKLNLMKLKQPPTGEKEVQNRSAIFNSDVDDSAESSSDDESPIFPSAAEAVGTTSGASPPVNKSKKLMKMVDRIAESKFFQAATENKYIKRAMEGVSRTDLRLKVEMRALEGTLVINIPPPPTDRIWVGFRPLPELSLSAHPIVGERNITFMHVTNWIEKKLIQEFQKLLVIPNMEDLIIPIMMSKLPE